MGVAFERQWKRGGGLGGPGGRPRRGGRARDDGDATAMGGRARSEVRLHAGERPQYPGPFCDNIERFVRAEGQPVPGLPVPGAACWVLDAAVDGKTARLHVYREDLDASQPPVCDHCRIIGEAQKSSAWRWRCPEVQAYAQHQLGIAAMAGIGPIKAT